MKTLKERRVISDLTFCFRILRKESKLSASKYWVLMPTSIRNGSFNIHYRKIGKKKQSLMFNNLFNRCARWMQLLPPHILEADNSLSFRRRLEKLDFAQLVGIRWRLLIFSISCSDGTILVNSPCHSVRNIWKGRGTGCVHWHYFFCVSRYLRRTKPRAGKYFVLSSRGRVHNTLLQCAKAIRRHD